MQLYIGCLLPVNVCHSIIILHGMHEVVHGSSEFSLLGLLHFLDQTLKIKDSEQIKHRNIVIKMQ